MNNLLPRLGVGITYSSAIEPLLRECPQLCDVVEVEPQTTWIATPAGPESYRQSDEVIQHLAALPARKLVHSVGTPVGGTVRPDPAQLGLLRDAITRLGAPWASDHLSFNATPEFSTGFFLPPRQTPEGVETVARAIQDLKDALPVPLAVETGVNYLRPRPDELPDGAFVAAVVEQADCGILLDLHNIFANELNGRQPVDNFLAQLPLERVWEIHLAGGMEVDGFWLDAHSGTIPDPLFRVAKHLVPDLPNLKAIVFEIFPSFVSAVGIDLIRAQIERLHELWSLRSTLPLGSWTSPQATPLRLPQSRREPTPEAWERTLGTLAIGRTLPDSDELGRDLSRDPGVGLMTGLIQEFRASMVVGVLRLTSRLIMLTLGADVFRGLLQEFWRRTPPQMFASVEADAFAEFLTRLDLKVPQLSQLLRFERAVVATLTDDQSRVVQFDNDPLPLLRALAEGRLPDVPGHRGSFEIELTPRGPLKAMGLDLEAIRQVFPYH